jgi:D-alanine-D-alanine ligase
VPYVGSGVLASALCIDKSAAKGVYRTKGLPVADDLEAAYGEDDPREAAQRAIAQLGSPVVVKPLNQGSSVALTIASTPEVIAKALDEAWQHYPVALLEKYIEGRELTCAVLGNARCRALPPIEIVPAEGHQFFDYDAKYIPGQAQEICPAPLTEAETDAVCDLAVRAHNALGCRGLSRTDFIMDKQGGFYLLETNTLPGLTSNSLLPRAAAAAGMSFSKLLEELIRLGMEERFPYMKTLE